MTDLSMMDHFKERQRVQPAPLGLIMMAAVLEATLALFVPAAIGLHIAQWSIVALLVCCGVLFRELSIRVNAEHLVFGFGPITRRVKLSDISSANIVEADSLRVGIGVHVTPQGNSAWIARMGAAVEIQLNHRDARLPKGYIISTSRPQALASALQAGNTSRAIEAP